MRPEDKTFPDGTPKINVYPRCCTSAAAVPDAPSRKARSRTVRLFWAPSGIDLYGPSAGVPAASVSTDARNQPRPRRGRPVAHPQRQPAP